MSDPVFPSKLRTQSMDAIRSRANSYRRLVIAGDADATADIKQLHEDRLFLVEMVDTLYGELEASVPALSIKPTGELIMAREWLVDTECYELAKHFLPKGTEESLRSLSQDIQDAVEDWFLVLESTGSESNQADGNDDASATGSGA